MFPCIVHWEAKHYVVVIKANHKKVIISDPARGKRELTRAQFEKNWLKHSGNDSNEGAVLLLEPTNAFYKQKESDQKLSFTSYLRYFNPHKRLIVQLLLGLLLSSLFSLLIPILTKVLIDKGVSAENIRIVYLVLIGQVMLFVGKTSISMIRSWLMLHITTRVDINVISDFLSKLMRLPIAYFDKKHVGDLLQRIRDHTRIKFFLTGTPLNSVFSLFNLLVLSVVMLSYSQRVFLIFSIGSAAYIYWVTLFLKRRKEIDYERFEESSKNHSREIQMIQGMQEIKLNSAETQKKREWQEVQLGLFKVNIKSLTLEQYQSAGSDFINELKNILITFISAKEVIEGNMTLGMMMAITQIVGQMNVPILQFVGVIRQAQDAKISLERLNEIHERPDEDLNKTISHIQENSDLILENLSFSYDSYVSKEVLKNINLTIEHGKTTAIVGASGSGKTTLMKLLLGFYQDYTGHFKIGNNSLRDIELNGWREKCGAVMQDGFQFADTVANNIAVAGGEIDWERLKRAAKIACIHEHIESLPLGYHTQLDHTGTTFSKGQSQRLLIARAVYKDPEYLFFDEATSALDTKNESQITKNLETYWKDKTVVIIAHRLSTVINADKIIVIDDGQVVEEGNKQQLLANKGIFYDLIRNQLQLEQS